MTESNFHLERLGSHDGNLARIVLKHGSTTVGRILGNNIVCSSVYVSKKHCVIIVTEEDEVKVKFESTTNGIFINGHQKLDVNSEIFLQANDIIGIGCDTSNDEINNHNCFVFQLKRKLCELISLVESDEEEEESKVQEQYSQLNLVEMKQELMELDEFVEEYSRIKTEPEDDQLLPNIDDVPTVYVSDEEEEEEAVTEDIFENIISNSGTYAEKSKLINGLVPDVATLLKKDCSTIDRKNVKTEIVPLKSDDLPTKNEPVIKTRRATVSLLKIDVTAFTRKNLHKKEKKVKHATTIHHKLSCADDELQRNSHRNFDSINEVSNKQINGKIMKRRHTCFVPSLNVHAIAGPSKRTLEIVVEPQIETTKEQPNKHVNGKITNRRHSCYFPSLNQLESKSSLKRKVEIIDAPHMPKRRKSISSTLENCTRLPKKAEVNWMSKKPQTNQKKRTKEEKDELKSRLAAIAESSKEKVVEVKAVRTTTKIPVKNTQKTRNDFLTDTIVKSAPAPSVTKSKKTDTTHSPKATSNVRIVETKVTSSMNRIPLRIAPHSSNSKSVAVNELTSPKSDESSTCDLNGNSSKISFAATTTTVVKSILKKPNQITRRRSTVTFSDDFRTQIRPKNDASKIDTADIQEDDSDDVLTNIMSLGVSSLKKSSSSPPVNGKNFKYQAVAHQYDSLKQLQSVFVPLMKTELWKEIEDGYFQQQNKPEIHVQLNYCVQDEDHKNRHKYRCQTYSSAPVQIGSLVLVSSKKNGKDFLGYIVHRKIMNRTCFFDFVTPFVNPDPASSTTVLTMKPIMYIRPNLKVFDALFKLKSSPLLQHILQPALYCDEPPVRPFKYIGFNSLNKDQMATLNKVYLRFIATRPFVSLIEGPPGTGKSRLITNLVVQLSYGNEIVQPPKILVCAPSNAAIDIITKNLLLARKNYEIKDPKRKKMKIVRFGVLEKMDRSVRCTSIQELIKANETRVLAERENQMDRRKKKQVDLENLVKSNLRNTSETRLKIDSLRKDISAIDATLKKGLFDESALLENADIICTTLNSCCTLSSKISSMDICIIDEATQCNEPTSLIPLQFNVRGLVLVGDTKQLASTVVSEIAKQYNYDQSLFQRLQKSFEVQDRNPISQLSLQYRMHPDILHWPNEYFYKNRLVSANSTKTNSFKLKPYTIIDLNFEQSTHSGQKHISNIDEAHFVRHLLDFLITKANPKSYSYGIISAYSQQKDDLARNLGSKYPFVTVNTIDSCQGQERDIIIISIARSRGIGFLAIRQRLNVALTRARKMLIVCGNFNMLQSHSMWNKLLDDAKQRKMYTHLPKMDDHLYQSYFEKYMIH